MAAAAGTVSFGAKNASRGASTVCGSTVHDAADSQLPRRAAVPLDRLDQHLGEGGDLVLVVGDRRDRDHGVAVGHLHRHARRR